MKTTYTHHHLNYALSYAVATTIQAQPYRCWLNSFLSHRKQPDLLRNGFYIEGWLVTPKSEHIEVIEHGWCVMADDTLLDPSIVLLAAPTHPLYFFPGIAYSHDELDTLSHIILPFVCYSDYGPDGMGHAGYRQAHVQAQGAARHLAHGYGFSHTAIETYTRDPNPLTMGFALLP